MYLTIHQIAPSFAFPARDYKLSKARMIVGKKQPNGALDYIRSQVGTQEDLTLELNDLSRGEYIVFMQADWEEPQIANQFVFSTYSNQELNLSTEDIRQYMPLPLPQRMAPSQSLLSDDLSGGVGSLLLDIPDV